LLDEVSLPAGLLYRYSHELSGGQTSDLADHYRRRANRARQVDKGVTTRAMKARMLDEAAHYDQLRAELLLSLAPSRSRAAPHATVDHEFRAGHVRDASEARKSTPFAMPGPAEG
jgi:hypothetical protein